MTGREVKTGEHSSDVESHIIIINKKLLNENKVLNLNNAHYKHIKVQTGCKVHKRICHVRGLATCSGFPQSTYSVSDPQETTMGNIGNKALAVETAKEEVDRSTGSLHGTAEKELDVDRSTGSLHGTAEKELEVDRSTGSLHGTAEKELGVDSSTDSLHGTAEKEMELSEK